MQNFNYDKKYDVIVVGAGHAGCEAALAAARMGCQTLILTLNVDNIALMSCNPAIGGLAKGQLVREIDAMGGEMGKAIDATGIQFRLLNTSKGPAVWAPRAQADKQAYRLYMKKVLEAQPNLDVKQGIVSEILVTDNKLAGVKVKTGTVYHCQALVIATGTFMKGLIHIGHTSFAGGRCGEISAEDISASLQKLGLKLGRLKTGTTPRLDSRTIDYSQTIPQPGDIPPQPFSFDTENFAPRQIDCYLTNTTEKTHQIIRDNLKESALFSGRIKGVGPRYCPSIEDKIVRFAAKERHQIFLEPEGLSTQEVYTNGFSTSLSEEVQLAALRTIPGLEKVEIIRPAYAIEYDFVYQYQINSNLETKTIGGLFLAGQINGTSGYEEAAAQGIMAGINAVLKIRGENALVLSRSQAYIGVLIDDLVTKGTEEPYRMFTSRAEYRLLLRQDNADLRLRNIGYRLGLVPPDVYEKFQDKQRRIKNYAQKLHDSAINPSKENQQKLTKIDENLNKKTNLAEILKRPAVTIDILRELGFWTETESPLIEEQVQIEIKYEGYIKRQEEQVALFEKNEHKLFPTQFNYDLIPGLTNEAREKLKKFQPCSLGQASRISGITPADVSIMLIFMVAQERKNAAVQ